MLKQIKLCDICQSEITSEEMADMAANDYITAIELITQCGVKNMDLCTKCSNRLVRYIYHMPTDNSQETHSL